MWPAALGLAVTACLFGLPVVLYQLRYGDYRVSGSHRRSDDSGTAGRREKRPFRVDGLPVRFRGDWRGYTPFSTPGWGLPPSMSDAS